MLVLFAGGAAYLVQLERHAHGGREHGLQQRHVGEHPLVARARDAEVPLEQRVQPVQEELHAAGACNTKHITPLVQKAMQIYVFKRLTQHKFMKGFRINLFDTKLYEKPYNR